MRSESGAGEDAEFGEKTGKMAGARRGRGWWVLGVMSMPAVQAVQALLKVQVRLHGSPYFGSGVTWTAVSNHNWFRLHTTTGSTFPTQPTVVTRGLPAQTFTLELHGAVD